MVYSIKSTWIAIVCNIRLWLAIYRSFQEITVHIKTRLFARKQTVTLEKSGYRNTSCRISRSKMLTVSAPVGARIDDAPAVWIRTTKTPFYREEPTTYRLSTRQNV